MIARRDGLSDVLFVVAKRRSSGTSLLSSYEEGVTHFLHRAKLSHDPDIPSGSRIIPLPCTSRYSFYIRVGRFTLTNATLASLNIGFEEAGAGWHQRLLCLSGKGP